jgi:hypothetical protein
MARTAYADAICQAQQPESSSTVEPDARLVEAFYPKAKREIVKGDYLRHKWGARYGPRFYSLIRTIRGFCSYDIKEGEAMCFPSEETLACECGVTRRTIINWLARKTVIENGEEKVKFSHPRHGEALQQFLRIVPRLRYDPVGQRSVKTSHRYFICMDDPPVPEDMPLIWERARQLAVQYLKRQAEEEKQESRRQECEARSARAASFGPEDCTRNNVKTSPPQQGENFAQDHHSLSSLTTFDSYRSPQEGECAAQAIRNGKAAANQQVKRTKGDEEYAANTASASKSNSATAQRSEDQFRRAASLADEDQDRDDARFQAAWETAGGIISSLLEAYGDAPAVARRDTFKVLRAYLALGAPIEQIAPLAYLARTRVKAFEMRGGRILKTRAGYYISTVCNLAHEARKKGWDVERIRKADQAQPAQQEEQPQQERRWPVRWEARRPTQSTLEEAEALVIELGQRSETYAEAQAQVRQREEQRQAREAHQQAVRQQAQLYHQLDQAEQVLKTFPAGSLARERAQREKQEVEQQIAKLRQPGEVTLAASAVSPESIHHPPMQARNEQEYREAIHAWARARGWTVKHRGYGGSQRDWQIGLMGVCKAELCALVAELGI